MTTHRPNGSSAADELARPMKVLSIVAAVVSAMVLALGSMSSSAAAETGCVYDNPLCLHEVRQIRDR